jgi:hypothetical protein
VPISNALLSLGAPQSDGFYNAASENYGHFLFGEIPDGFHALRVEAGAAPGGRSIKPVNLLFPLSHSAAQRNLSVDEADPVGRSCGGWSIQPDRTTGL